MGNTLGAMVFLAAATYLGWTIVRGRAQSFLSAASGGAGATGTDAQASTSSASTPAPVVGGPVAGAGFPFTDLPAAPAPTVFGNAFGQNGSLNSPTTSGPYGVYSPLEIPGVP
jgi:hypothetical protein